MLNSSLWPREITLSSASIRGQFGYASNGNEVVQHVPKISKNGALPSDRFYHITLILVGGV